MQPTAKPRRRATVARPAPPRKRSRRWLAVGLAVLLVVGGSAASLAELPSLRAELRSDVKDSPPKPVFHEFPSLLVDASSVPGREAFLKLDVTLQLRTSGDEDYVDRVAPLITDRLEGVFWEMPVEDLAVPGALARMRHEAVKEIASAIGGGIVQDVLITQAVLNNAR
jgi:flagellar basal body-associated protein FliL